MGQGVAVFGLLGEQEDVREKVREKVKEDVREDVREESEGGCERESKGGSEGECTFQQLWGRRNLLMTASRG